MSVAGYQGHVGPQQTPVRVEAVSEDACGYLYLAGSRHAAALRRAYFPEGS